MKTFNQLLQEKRRNAQQNIERETSLSFIQRLWKDENYYSVFMTLTSVPKLGINPVNQYNTPTGVYCYCLRDYIKDIIKNDMSELPFIPENTKFVSFFSLKDDDHIVNTKTFSEDDMNTALAKLEAYYEKVIDRFSTVNVPEIDTKLTQQRANIVDQINRLKQNTSDSLKSTNLLVSHYLTLPSEFSEVPITGIQTKTELDMIDQEFSKILAKIFDRSLSEESPTQIINFIRAGFVLLARTKTSGLNKSLKTIKELKIKLKTLTKEQQQEFGHDFLMNLARFETLMKKSHGQASPIVYARKELAIANLRAIIKSLETYNTDHQELLQHAKNDLKTLLQQSSQFTSKFANDTADPNQLKRLEYILSKIDDKIKDFEKLFVPSKVMGFSQQKMTRFPPFNLLMREASGYFNHLEFLNSSSYNFKGQAQYFFEVWKATHIVASLLAFPLHTLAVNLWNRILVKVLNISAVIDTFGIIHENEKMQTVVLNTSLIDLIKIVPYSNTQIIGKDNIRDASISELMNLFSKVASVASLFERAESDYLKIRMNDILNDMPALKYLINLIINDSIVKASIKHKRHWIYDLYTGTYGKTRKIPERFRKMYGNWWDEKMKKLVK